jgi:antitoxin component YwqK of YwqJK toxin-antitoxin module
MKNEGNYKNGQKISETNGELLTYYYKSGVKKAEGKYSDEKFEGEWLFYNENGTLSQEGNFKNNEKDGDWKRFNEDGEIIYHVEFKNGKQIKKYK